MFKLLSFLLPIAVASVPDANDAYVFDIVGRAVSFISEQIATSPAERMKRNSLVEMSVLRARLVECEMRPNLSSETSKKVSSTVVACKDWFRVSLAEYEEFLSKAVSSVGLDDSTIPQMSPENRANEYLRWLSLLSSAGFANSASTTLKSDIITMVDGIKSVIQRLATLYPSLAEKVKMIDELCSLVQLALVARIPVATEPRRPIVMRLDDILTKIGEIKLHMKYMYSVNLNVAWIRELNAIISLGGVDSKIRTEAIALRDQLFDKKDSSDREAHVLSVDNIESKIAFATHVMVLGEGVLTAEIEALLGNVAVWQAHLSRGIEEISKDMRHKTKVGGLESLVAANSKHALVYINKQRASLDLPVLAEGSDLLALRMYLTRNLGEPVYEKFLPIYGNREVARLAAMNSCYASLHDHFAALKASLDGNTRSAQEMFDYLERVSCMQSTLGFIKTRKIELSKVIEPVIALSHFVTVESDSGLSLFPPAVPSDPVAAAEAKIAHIIDLSNIMVTTNLAEKWATQLKEIAAIEDLPEGIKAQATAAASVLSNKKRVEALRRNARSLHDIQKKLDTVTSWCNALAGEEYSLEIEGILAMIVAWRFNLLRLGMEDRTSLLPNHNSLWMEIHGLFELATPLFMAQRSVVKKKGLKLIMPVPGQKEILPELVAGGDRHAQLGKALAELYKDENEGQAVALRSSVAAYSCIWWTEQYPAEISAKVHLWVQEIQETERAFSVALVADAAELVRVPKFDLTRLIQLEESLKKESK